MFLHPFVVWDSREGHVGTQTNFMPLNSTPKYPYYVDETGFINFLPRLSGHYLWKAGPRGVGHSSPMYEDMGVI